MSYFIIDGVKFMSHFLRELVFVCCFISQAKKSCAVNFL